MAPRAASPLPAKDSVRRALLVPGLFEPGSVRPSVEPESTTATGTETVIGSMARNCGPPMATSPITFSAWCATRRRRRPSAASASCSFPPATPGISRSLRSPWRGLHEVSRSSSMTWWCPWPIGWAGERQYYTVAKYLPSRSGAAVGRPGVPGAPEHTRALASLTREDGTSVLEQPQVAARLAALAVPDAFELRERAFPSGAVEGRPGPESSSSWKNLAVAWSRHQYLGSGGGLLRLARSSCGVLRITKSLWSRLGYGGRGATPIAEPSSSAGSEEVQKEYHREGRAGPFKGSLPRRRGSVSAKLVRSSERKCSGHSHGGKVASFSCPVKTPEVGESAPRLAFRGSENFPSDRGKWPMAGVRRGPCPTLLKLSQ